MESDPPTETHSEPHGIDGMVDHNGSISDHGGAPGGDDPGHADVALGPVDLRLWGAAALGLVLGLVVAVALAIGASFRIA